MRWEDERYVRLYTRDSASWVLGPWEARAVLGPVLRKLDRAGTVDLGSDGLEGLAALVAMPLAVVEAGMAWWLKRGTFELVAGGHLVMGKFLEAQEAPASDAKRAREARERARDRARGVVTDRHDPSQAVTPSCAVPSRTVPPVPRESAHREALRSPIPEGMTLPADWRSYAETLPVTDVDAVFVKFCAWHRSEGITKPDWFEAWKYWLVGERNRQATARSKGRSGSVPTVQPVPAKGRAWEAKE